MARGMGKNRPVRDYFLNQQNSNFPVSIEICANTYLCEQKCFAKDGSLIMYSLLLKPATSFQAHISIYSRTVGKRIFQTLNQTTNSLSLIQIQKNYKRQIERCSND